MRVLSVNESPIIVEGITAKRVGLCAPLGRASHTRDEL